MVLWSRGMIPASGVWPALLGALCLFRKHAGGPAFESRQDPGFLPPVSPFDISFSHRKHLHLLENLPEVSECF